MVPKRQMLNKPRTITYFPSGYTIYETDLFNFDHIFQVVGDGNKKGNFKDPNSVEFFKQVIQCWNMKFVYYNPPEYGGGLDKIVSGNSATAPALYANDVTTRDPSAFSRAFGEVGSKLRGDLDLSVALAETGQTVKMFKDLKKIVDYVHLYRPANVFNWYREFKRDWNRIKHNPGSVPKAIGGKWLEFQYGWKPLAQDLYDTAIQLDKALPHLMKVEAKATSKENRFLTDLMSYDGGRYAIDVFVSDSRRVLLSYEFVIDPSATDFLSRFTSLNPASIAWELTPFSFVVDWVYDVGGYLRNLENAVLFHNAFKGGFETYGSRIRVTSNSPLNAPSRSLSGGYNYVNWKKRVPVSVFPWPTKPRFNVSLGSGRVLNASALLSQFLGKR